MAQFIMEWININNRINRTQVQSIAKVVGVALRMACMLSLGVGSCYVVTNLQLLVTTLSKFPGFSYGPIPCSTKQR